MLQVQIHASQEKCWELLSQPEAWHRWAPWLLVDVPEEKGPGQGSRIKARFIRE